MSQPPDTPGAKIRVLYADDDPQISDVVQTYFARMAPDCTLEIVPDGRSCLDRMDRGGIDVLMLDFELPDIDGLHILNELASRGDPTPVVVVSGKGQTKLAVKALRAGAVDCIDKTSPQFLELPAIVQHVHARHREKFAGKPTPPLPSTEKYHVLLIESREGLRRNLTEFFAQHAPRFTLVTLQALDGLEHELTSRVAFDAIIVGPNPGAQGALDALRKIHSHSVGAPVIVLAARNDGETAVAAFKLGAQDYILQTEGYLTELVFSLNNLLRRADVDRLNQRLACDLAELNRSLEAQVAARTLELSNQVAVRQKAERAAADHAARLQTLSKRLFKIQEDERRAIARELHDQVGQMLTGLKMQLETLNRQAAAAGTPATALQEQLAESLNLATDLMGHVRGLTQQFRPRILDDLGLRAALEWHARLFQKQTNVATTVDVSLPQERLSIELEIAVFRIVQEALTNVARHAGCAAAVVTVTHAEPMPGVEGRLIVEIADRGRGFDVDSVVASGSSIGLTGLTERVTLAGGTVEIFSRVGQGTRIQAEFPLGVTAEPKPTLTPVETGGTS